MYITLYVSGIYLCMFLDYTCSMYTITVYKNKYLLYIKFLWVLFLFSHSFLNSVYKAGSQQSGILSPSSRFWKEGEMVFVSSAQTSYGMKLVSVFVTQGVLSPSYCWGKWTHSLWYVVKIIAFPGQETQDIFMLSGKELANEISLWPESQILVEIRIWAT